MKQKKFSIVIAASLIVVALAIVFTFFLSGCVPSLDEVYEVPYLESKVPESLPTPSDSAKVDTVQVQEWASVDAGTVTFGL